jgi:hypothetical protein
LANKDTRQSISSAAPVKLVDNGDGTFSVAASITGSLPNDTTLQDSVIATGNGTSVNTSGQASLILQISGTFVGTVTFEATQDNINWVAILGQNLNSGAQTTNTTSPGMFGFPVNGLKQVRARVSAYTSGNITVKGTPLAQPLAALSSATINASVDFVKIKDPTGTNALKPNSDGSLNTLNGVINQSPLTGAKTVIATAAEVFAGASAKSNRRMLFIKNTDPVLRCKVGASGVSQQTGTSLEPGAAVEIKFDPGIYVPIFAISEGASIKVEVWEV